MILHTEKFYAIGDQIKVSGFGGGSDYLLATTTGLNAILISLFDGNRWNEGIEVDDRFSITPEELENIIFNKLEKDSGNYEIIVTKKSPYKP